MKKKIRLTESELKQIVKESVNNIISESYGTPDKWTKSATHNINQARNGQHFIDKPDFIKNADNEEVNAEFSNFLNYLLVVCDKLRTSDILHKLNDKYTPNANPSYQPYVQELYKIENKLRFVINRMISIANMENGEQPDEYYDTNHESYKQKQRRRKKEAYYGNQGDHTVELDRPMW